MRKKAKARKDWKPMELTEENFGLRNIRKCKNGSVFYADGPDGLMVKYAGYWSLCQPDHGYPDYFNGVYR